MANLDYEALAKKIRNRRQLEQWVKEVELSKFEDVFFERCSHLKKKYSVRDGEKFKGLKTMYEIISHDVLLSNREKKIKTASEVVLARVFSNILRAKVLSSFVIADKIYDLFIPSLSLLVELDGPVHFNEAKMRKDIEKLVLANYLDLNVMHLQNQDIDRITSRFVFEINGLPKTSQFKVKRKWRDIYIATLLKNGAFSNYKYGVSNGSK